MAPVREVNVIDVCLVSILIYLIIVLVRPARRPRSAPVAEGYNKVPEQHPQCLVHKQYTPLELSVFNGKQGTEGRILLAIERRAKAKDEKEAKGWREVRLERTVFDVTAGRSFYGPGKSSSVTSFFHLLTRLITDGPYGNFAGRDASLGMAKQSFEEEMLTPLDEPLNTLDGLTMDEMSVVLSSLSQIASKTPP